MCKFLSKSGEVPFQPLGDLTWNDPIVKTKPYFTSTGVIFTVLIH